MNIIILDDSETVLMTIQSLLMDLGVSVGEISMFKNGVEALDFIEQNGADIIFSDVQMPGISGYEFVERLLEISGKFVSTLFIVSANDNHESFVKMKQSGAKRFIRKPINAHHFNHFVAPEIAKIREKTGFDTQNAVDCGAESVNDSRTIPLTLDFDHEALAQKIGINVKYVPRLLESFFKEAKNVIEGLERASETKEFSKISHYAHSLKGSAGNMKFDELYEMAKEMENAALREDSSFAYNKYYLAIKASLEASFTA